MKPTTEGAARQPENRRSGVPLKRAATLLDVSYTTLYNAVRAGRVRVVPRLNRKSPILVPPSEIRRLSTPTVLDAEPYDGDPVDELLDELG